VVGFALTRGGGDGGGGGEAQPVAVAVDGAKAYTDTEIDLKAGDRVTIEATGRASHNAGAFTTPDGDANPALDEFSVIKGASHNALIGKITRGGDPFFVGSFAQFRAEEAGRLFLGVNDTGVQNNSGRYNAKVTVERA
jgi:hypothetical protein